MRWDDVVVGAGSAGAVVAARLSETPGRRVLLLEAGPDHPAAATPPSIAGANFLPALSEPGRVWDGLEAHPTPGSPARPYLRGRGVGGSSAINGMIALRGLPADYDRWERDFGCTGWAWRDLRSAFARVAQRCAVTTVPPAERGAVERALRAAATAPGGGFALSAGEHELGWMDVPLTSAGGRRQSTNDCYLEPARRAGRLTIRGDATVTRVVLDGRRAVGVELAGGEQVEAARVVVSAGAIHSPALLLRSGIDRPGLGRNLRDHPSAQAMLILREFARADPLAPPISGLARWSSASGVEADLQLLPMDMAGIAPEAAGLGVVNVAVMQVHSTGRVSLDPRAAGRDPSSAPQPRIDLQLLDDERDLVRLVEAFRTLLALLRAPEVRAIASAVVLDELGTPAESLDGATDDELASWVRGHVGDYVHASGTCRMGAPGDDGAVVDPRCRVIGYDGLAVVDASVMPDVPRANTHLPTMAVAEHAAALLRDTG